MSDQPRWTHSLPMWSCPHKQKMPLRLKRWQAFHASRSLTPKFHTSDRSSLHYSMNSIPFYATFRKKQTACECFRETVTLLQTVLCFAYYAYCLSISSARLGLRHDARQIPPLRAFLWMESKPARPRQTKRYQACPVAHGSIEFIHVALTLEPCEPCAPCEPVTLLGVGRCQRWGKHLDLGAVSISKESLAQVLGIRNSSGGLERCWNGWLGVTDILQIVHSHLSTLAAAKRAKRAKRAKSILCFWKFLAWQDFVPVNENATLQLGSFLAEVFTPHSWQAAIRRSSRQTVTTFLKTNIWYDMIWHDLIWYDMIWRENQRKWCVQRQSTPKQAITSRASQKASTQWAEPPPRSWMSLQPTQSAAQP